MRLGLFFFVWTAFAAETPVPQPPSEPCAETTAAEAPLPEEDALTDVLPPGQPDETLLPDPRGAMRPSEIIDARIRAMGFGTVDEALRRRQFRGDSRD